jgi:hypothetical protein
MPQSIPEQSEFLGDPRKKDGSCEHFLPMPGNRSPKKEISGAELTISK